MRTRLVIILALGAPILLAGEASAQDDDICAALGLSGLTISSDSNCLQITGEVRYEFTWGDYKAPNGQSVAYTDDVANTDFGLSFNAGATFGSKITSGVYSTENPGLIVPAYDYSYQFNGYQAGLEAGGTVRLPGLNIFVKGGFEYGSSTAAFSSDGMSFPELGFPSVDEIPGTNINSPTDLTSFDFNARRDAWIAYLNGGIPLAEGLALMGGDLPVEYRIGALVGLRAGALSQDQEIAGTTWTPAFVGNESATNSYLTSARGTLYGPRIGAWMDKEIPFGGNGLAFQSSTSLLFGYDMYDVDIEDSVTAEGLGNALNYSASNAYSKVFGVPNFELQSSVGVGTANWTVALKTGVSLGKNVVFDYERLDDGTEPDVYAIPDLVGSIGFGVEGRF